MKGKISVSVSLKKYTAGTIRYAAHAVSGLAYVLLEPGKNATIEAVFEPKPAASAGERAGLKKRFKSELEDEKIRSGIAASGRESRDFIVLKALRATAARAPGGDSRPAPAREKKLAALVAGIECGIKPETAGKARKDLLGITGTWEEKYDAKSFKGRKK